MANDMNELFSGMVTDTFHFIHPAADHILLSEKP